ncbi:MAG: alpha/beta hydrolase-fold protein [Acidobacteriota bacterium]
MRVFRTSVVGSVLLGFLPAAIAAFPDVSQLPAEDVKKGVALFSEGADFLWAFDSAKRPVLMVDGKPRGPMKRIGARGPWTYAGQLKTGTSHSFYYLVEGKRVGGLTDVPAFGPDSYAQPGVPQGKLSAKMTLTSKIYQGMKSDYWVYVPAQYDSGTPAALMIWQDGHYHVERDGPAQVNTSGQPPSRLQNAIDNLTQQKKIPVAIWLLIDPGTVDGPDGKPQAMRSIEYDTVSDRYPRFLREEVLPELYGQYNIRRDGYSHAIAGNSSGGICAFNAAWYMPELFSRVLARIPSFTSIQWKPGEQDGGNIYPFRVRKEPKRNIRVWMQDGSEDMEQPFGSWPLQSIQMANSLKIRDYDFHFSFGTGTHNHAQSNAEMPEALTWLWRDYDAAKKEQVFEMEPAEKAKPVFRVRIYNRD